MPGVLVMDAGQAGEGVYWQFCSDGTLYILGEGEMPIFEEDAADAETAGQSWMSYRSKIRSVIIGEGITSICKTAFYRCDKLSTVVIPDSVTSIGNGAFGGCSSLTSIDIPDSVTDIGRNPFMECGSLTQINISSDNPALVVVGGVLYSKPDKRLVSYPYASQDTGYTIAPGTEIIGSRAFFSCSSLTSVTVPDGVTTIDAGAFYSCDRLASITIPDSVVSIGSNAFDHCSDLKDVYYDGTESGWNEISIEDKNDALLNARLHTDVTYDYTNQAIGYDVRIGANNDKVKTIQQRLSDLGYFDHAVDGVYEDETKAAIEAFQKNNGIHGNPNSYGVATTMTQTVLFSDGVRKAGQQPRFKSWEVSGNIVCNEYNAEVNDMDLGSLSFKLINRDAQPIVAIGIRLWIIDQQGNTIGGSIWQNRSYDLCINPGDGHTFRVDIRDLSYDAVAFRWAITEIVYANGEVYMDYDASMSPDDSISATNTWINSNRSYGQ